MMKIFHRYARLIASFFIVEMLFQVFYTSAAYALTSGPTQPEVQSFQPAGTSEMVDLFSGDFSYNIPLFELPGPNGGYPFNLSYQSGISMDAEASWVGLGFNLNPGAINRQMRGLPDEFKGDKIATKMAIEPSVTVGLGVGLGLEFFGAAKDIGTLGVGVSYNNFKGFGYSIDGNVGFHTANTTGATAGIGLSIKLDSQEGVSASPNLSLTGKMGEFGLSTGYNSKTGMNSLTASHEANGFGGDKKKKIGEYNHHDKKGSAGSSSASLSLAHPGYTPQVSLPMRNINLAARFQPGAAWWGLFPKEYIKGFYNEQWLHDNKSRKETSAYGYLNYDAAQGNGKAVLDFNREKDGMVTKEAPNLAIPSLTYDIYSVTGQGIGAMYRPMRNDYGIVHDPETESVSTGVSAGVDVAVWASKVGVNLNVNHGRSVSGKWTESNGMNGASQFQQKKANDAYEPVYFKVHGESTAVPASQLANLGGTSAVRVQLDGQRASASASSKLETEGGAWSRTLPNAATTDRDRKPRSQVIETITNAELQAGGKTFIPHLQVKYITDNGTEADYVRNAPGHHIAAFTALTAEGLRYNYGIPAYNLKQEEVTFSVKKQNVSRVAVGNAGGGDPSYAHDGTEKFLKRVEMPKYAHSYLLTSIIGPDYVDVTGDGVTEDDLGYWVKFTYKKTTTTNDPYRWRDPYSKAHYQQGWKTDPRDDKGSFTYGEKEMWYLVRAETKSHIAAFTLEERDDAMGVKAKLQDKNDRGQKAYALREIKLFARTSGSSTPIKVVKFDYDYSLCPGVYNNKHEGAGKLTLKSVWFQYGNSTRGELNPYEFKYHAGSRAYNQLKYDRWGNYKSYPGTDSLYNIDFPYAEQNPMLKDSIDSYAASWSLQEIKLPSGGKITVDYESDDYAYVQHLPAMQMMELADPAGKAKTGDVFKLGADGLVRFKLEKTITATPALDNDPLARRREVMKYIDVRRKQLYFKMLVNLQAPGKPFEEYVSGYADINVDATMDLHKVGNEYVYGSFYVHPEKGAHPFVLRAWQHIRTNQPELSYPGSKLTPRSGFKDRVEQITGLTGVFTQVRQMFTGFYDYCRNRDWGREVRVGRSWIRLNSPDKVKYGGGLRVKQITMSDNWEHDADGVYGQVYDYTTADGTDVISSGVAAYEPIIGGEENALRYAKRFTESVPLRSDNNMFFEYPINESYYPGAQVGYSKVTVMSLAAASLAGRPVKLPTSADGKTMFPTAGKDVSYGTSGVTVHEFYTAKDYPVIADETGKDNEPYQLSVPIPFLGNVSVSKLTASQGYSIITNDMHGKLKKMSTYQQDRQGKVGTDAVSWVMYHYMDDARTYEQQSVSVVNGLFKDNGDGTLSVASTAEAADPSVPKYNIGQETELFMDMRQYEDNTWEGGLSFNTEILYIPVIIGVITLPVFVPWPSVGKTSQQLRTSVTNKVIFRTGILASVEAHDGGSVVHTENLKWDKLTGAVVLTTAENNFGDPVYSYSIPAYTQYQGMGAAFNNIGLTFSIGAIERLEANSSVYAFKPNVPVDRLFPGDEFLLYAAGGAFEGPVGRAVMAGEEDGELILYSKDPLTASSYNARIVRSGYRNHLNVDAGTISALEDPTRVGPQKVYQKLIQVPTE